MKETNKITMNGFTTRIRFTRSKEWASGRTASTSLNRKQNLTTQEKVGKTDLQYRVQD